MGILRRFCLVVVCILAVPAAGQEAINFAGPNMMAIANAAAMNDVYRDAYGTPGWRNQPTPPMSAAARRVLGTTNRVANTQPWS